MRKIILLFIGVFTLVGVSQAKTKWPKRTYGGNEKLLYGEERIQEMRYKIDNYPWAAGVYQTLQDNIEDYLANEEVTAAKAESKGVNSLHDSAAFYGDMALYYRISGDEQYLPLVVDVLVEAFNLADSDNILFPDKTKKNTALWVWLMTRGGLFHAYDLLKNHPLLTPYVPTMELRLEEIVGETKRYTTYMRHAGNTQFWCVTMGLGVAAILLDDVETFTNVLFNDYYGAEAILNSLKDGGVTRLEPRGYYYGYVSAAFTILAEIAQHNNIADLYHHTSSKGNTFEKLLDGMFATLSPSGTMLVNGDGGENLSISNGKILYRKTGLFDDGTVEKYSFKWEIYNQVYDNPHFAWILNFDTTRSSRCGYGGCFLGYPALTHGVAQLTEGEAPYAQSVVQPEVGDVHLKSIEGQEYWFSDAITVHLRAGSTLMNHNHNDHLHIKLDAFGKSIYTDWHHGYDYISPRATNNYANQTPISPKVLSHNTIAVDGGEPKNSNITFSELDRTSEGAQIVVATGTPYDGVVSTRTLCLTGEYLLDIYEVESSEPHTYDFILNSLGTLSAEGVGESFEYRGINDFYNLQPIDKWSKRERNEWIADARKAEVEEPTVTLTFRDSDGIGATATSICEEPTEFISGGLPLSISKFVWDTSSVGIAGMPERKPLAILRRECSSTTFYTLHCPFKDYRREVTFSRDGDILTITGEEFTDSFNLVTREYLRR